MIKVLDCTLRDGAHINDAKFGATAKRKILKNLVSAGIEIVEVGFLDDRKVYSPDKTYYLKPDDFRKESKSLNLDKTEITFLLRSGTCNPNNFSTAESNESIRIAFRKDETEQAFQIQETLDRKGYKTYFNPIGITNYSDREFNSILSRANNTSITGLSIVDTYGSLTSNQFNSFLNLSHSILDGNKSIGIHLHENLNKSSHFIYRILEEKAKGINRNFILDGSLKGMGRDPGNIPTELIVQILHEEKEESKYEIEYLSKTILEVIEDEYAKYPWGYDHYFFLTALFGIDRTYGEAMKKDKIQNPIQIIKRILKTENGDRYDNSVYQKVK